MEITIEYWVSRKEDDKLIHLCRRTFTEAEIIELVKDELKYNVPINFSVGEEAYCDHEIKEEHIEISKVVI